MLSSAGLTVGVLDASLFADAITPPWQALCSRLAEPNPWYEPEAVRAAARHLGARGVQLLVVRRDQQWLAAFPIRHGFRGHHPTLRIISAWQHRYCPLTTPLVDRDAPGDALAAIIDWVAARRALLVIEEFPTGGMVDQSLRAACRRYHTEPVVINAWDRAAVIRTESARYLLVNTPTKRRHNIERLRRRLEEAAESPLVTSILNGEPSEIDQFLALEASGWKGARGTALLSAPSDAAFFREISAAFRAQKRLEMMALGAAETTVAMQWRLVGDGVVFPFKIAYDERFRHAAPGLVLDYDALALFHDTPGRVMIDSLSAPDNNDLNSRWPDRRHIESVAYAPKIVPARLTAGLLKTAQRAAAAYQRRARPAGDPAATRKPRPQSP